jgi:predicted nucleic acid-binding protein
MSALIKRYVRESRSDDVVALLQNAEFVGTSALTQVEMASALNKAVRMGWLDENGASFAWSSFLTHWPSFVRLDVGSGLFERASGLVWEHNLRAYDATHLAVAQIWQEAIGENILFATFDKNLWVAARKSSVEVWPDNLEVR